jgi:iron complex transport system substrate-binding protein
MIVERTGMYGIALVLALISFFSGSALAIGVRVVDDTAREVVLPQPAARIISLAPHLTELAFAAGAANKLIAVSRYSDYPAGARSLPAIGDAANIDLERIVFLRPDLILGWKTGNSPFAIEKLRALGFSVYLSELETLPDIARVLRAIGVLSGTEPAANAAAVRFEGELDRIRVAHIHGQTLKVFVEIWRDPLITVTGRHMISDVLSMCGGQNIFAGLPGLTPAIGPENLLAADPDAIVGGNSADTRESFVKAWQPHEELRAARAKHVYFVEPDLLQRAGPRLLEGARQICTALDMARRSMQ